MQVTARGTSLIMAFGHFLRRAAVANAITTISCCFGLAAAQNQHRLPKTLVEGAKSAPVLLSQLPDGPGFIVTNVSHRAVTRIRFGCIAPGSSAKVAKVRFDMGEDSFLLDATGPRSRRSFEGYTPEQSICANRGSAITVLEVSFVGGKRWRLAHQIRDRDYRDDRTGPGDSVIR